MQGEVVGTSGGAESGRSEIVVLHVDDDAQIRDTVTAYLEKVEDDITVVTEPDAEAGLERLDADAVDCVVSDYDMPGMDGVEFLEAVRDGYPNLPFVLFTGKGSEDVASEAINAGVTSYLQKDGAETFKLLTNRVRNGVQRHRSERRATVARDRLLQLYEQTDGFLTLDEDWRITYWNRQMAERTGRDPAEVTGERLLDAFPEAEGTELHERYREAMETREAAEFQTYYEPNDYWVESRVYPVDEGLFVHTREISEEKEREREMRQRNQILESFANTVSHDLRNPLSVAEGNLELAQETGDFSHLDQVAEAHNRMRNLIDELLRIARDEEMTLSELSLAECATEGWETVSAADMELVVRGDATFNGHRSQLRRLFENLYWNALEHGDASAVSVGVLDGDGFYVEDDGIGIPADDRERVFDTGYSSAEEGAGYGLHIVESIADMHDWSVEVTASDDGGARFEIRSVALSDGRQTAATNPD